MGSVCANIHIKGSLEDGRSFLDTHIQGGVPINVTLGEGRFPDYVENAIRQMRPGETRTIHVPVHEAYGEYDPNLIETVPRSSIPHAENLPIGQYVMFPSENGAIRVKVVSMDNDNVVFDHNHELAGHDLIFDVELFKLLEDPNDPIAREKFFAQHSCGCKDALCH